MDKQQLYKEAQKVNWLIRPPVHNKDCIRIRNQVPVNWPEKTEACCWWCTYPFSTQPIPLPIKHDPLRDIFYIRGIFCSWSCVKAYALSLRSTTAVDIGNIMLLKTRSEKDWTGIPVAPPRESLQRFGGTKTIEEFRNSSLCLPNLVLPKNMISVEEKYEYSGNERKTFKDKKIEFGNLDTTDTSCLRLKRPTSSNVPKNTLAMTMGLRFKTTPPS